MVEHNNPFFETAFKKIEFNRKFPLIDYYRKVAAKEDRPHLKSASRIQDELHGQYVDLCLILDRINEHIENWNVEGAAFNKLASGEDSKEVRDIFNEAQERSKKDYLNLDIRVFFIFMNSFMDRVPLLIKSYFVSQSLPAHRSYSRFLSSLDKFSGKDIEKVKTLIASTKAWFPYVKEARDDYIIHQYSARGISHGRTGVASTTLTSKKKGGMSIIQTDTKFIEFLYDRLYFFLTELNDYLVSNADVAPFKDIEKI